MEDSYTVHRRRKAAARRREKTPDSRLTSLDLTDDQDKEQPSEHSNNEEKGSEKMDKEEDMRARMERMVEDTERMEMEQERRQLPASEESSSRAAVHEVRSKSPPVNRSSKSETSEKVKKTESPLKSPDYLQQQQLQQQQTQQQQLQQQLQQLHQLQQQQQQREQQEQQAREAEQAPVKEIRRRLGSPEEARARPARHLSPIASDQQPRRSSQRYSSDEEDAVDEERRRHQRSVRQQRRSASLRRSPVKKQIILINNEDLMEDIAKAKRAYSHRDPSDDYEYEDDGDEEEDEEKEKKSKTQPRSSTKEMSLRKRKPSVIHSDSEKERISQNVESSPGWFSWLFGRGSKKEKLEDEKKETKVTSEPVKVSIFTIFSEFSEFCRQNPEEVKILIELRNLCIVETIITLIICGLGGLAFRFTEGAFESFYKCGVKRVKRDFLDSLWNYSHNMKEDDWKSMARRKLMEFEEQLHEAHEAGISSYTGIKSWSFINSCMYCLTIISTIGYGHISPSTTTGRALTIIYAIIGIPMFLIVLADFGKLFTRGIKFLWAFVRRLYYTGSCRKVRRTVQVQEMMKGVQMVYDFATFRRPSQMSPEEIEEIKRQQQTVLNMDSSNPQQQSAESPSTPAMSTFEIDDEFNLPISVAITILVLYIFVGAVVFNVFEEWTFFESFYFVFISMSTIGFGDFVPQDPLYMMLSIVYMIFGLALTSMCINVVQVMLTDQFKQASQKIGASIGFQVSDEDGSLRPVEPIEIPEVHKATKIDTKEKIAPHAQPEEAEL